jgi:hypothetical protein
MTCKLHGDCITRKGGVNLKKAFAMNFTHIRLVLFLSFMATFVYHHNPSLESGEALAHEVDGISVGAKVVPSIYLKVTGGKNQLGKETRFVGNGIHFGEVSFIDPASVANGDAYLRDGYLFLEAVINVNVVFNGGDRGVIGISKFPQSHKSFHSAYYSDSVNRNANLAEIFTFPAENRVAILSGPQIFPVRLAFKVSPRQQGVLKDRFRIVGTME